MKKSLRKLIVLGAAAAAAGTAAMTLASAGVAGASPSVSGKTLSEAQAVLKTSGWSTIATVAIGDKQPQGNCTVIGQQDMPAGIAGWSTSDLVNGVFVGGDQPTLYPINLPNVPTAQVTKLTLACYGGSGIAAGAPTGAGDINAKPGS
jgi:hypothetical protein